MLDELFQEIEIFLTSELTTAFLSVLFLFLTLTGALLVMIRYNTSTHSGWKERRCPKGPLRREGPPTYAILSQNLKKKNSHGNFPLKGYPPPPRARKFPSLGLLNPLQSDASDMPQMTHQTFHRRCPR